MDPKHALQMLVNAADRAPMTKAEHLAAEQARTALTLFIESALKTAAQPVTQGGESPTNG